MAEEIRKKRRIHSNAVAVEKYTEEIPVTEVSENYVSVVVGGDLEQDEMLDQTHSDDETMSELLDSSSEASSLQQFNFKVKFIDNPYVSPVIVQSSSGYVTINGNEESCGSSFADLESSVMASVDRCSLIRTVSSESCGVWNGGACSSDGLKARDMHEVIEDLERFLAREMDGWDLLVNETVDGCDYDVWEKYFANDLLGTSS